MLIVFVPVPLLAETEIHSGKLVTVHSQNGYRDEIVTFCDPAEFEKFKEVEDRKYEPESEHNNIFNLPGENEIFFIEEILVKDIK
jgi:hypothetical protein